MSRPTILLRNELLDYSIKRRSRRPAKQRASIKRRSRRPAKQRGSNRFKILT